MTKTVKQIAANLKWLRELRGLSQKEVSVKTKIPQGQYSRMENGLVEPAISTLEKVAKVFDVPLTEFFKTSNSDTEINLSVMEKIKLLDSLDKDERKAIETVIDIAVSRKALKDKLTNLIKG